MTERESKTDAAVGPPSWRTSLAKTLSAWDGRHFILSPDVDGILSALILATETQAQPIGAYTTTTLVLVSPFRYDEAMKALWLDQDVSSGDTLCVGQHLVLHSDDDTLPSRSRQSFNPNVHFRQSYRHSFRGIRSVGRDKYPFGTSHFLADYFAGFQIPQSPDAFFLLGHADSAWQSAYKYSANANIWFNLMHADSPRATFLRQLLFDYCGTDIRGYVELRQRIQAAGVRAASSQTRPRGNMLPQEWAELAGLQTVALYRKNYDDFLRRLNALLEIASDILGCSNIPLRTQTSEAFSGSVKLDYPDRITPGSFDKYMVDNQIFSHAFIAQSKLRYTGSLAKVKE